MNEEFLKEIKSLLPWLVGAVIVIGGYYGVKNYRAAQKEAASNAFASVYTVEDMKEAVENYGGSDAGAAIKLRLAKKYFDDGRYEEALALYEELNESPAEGLADVSLVGRAATLEAMGKLDEAQAAYREFVAANPKSFLKLTAQLGVARVMAQKGEQDKALELVATIKSGLKDNQLATYRVEAVEDTIKRYKK